MNKLDPFETHPSITPASTLSGSDFGAFGLERAVEEARLLQLEIAALRAIIRQHFDGTEPDFEEKLNKRVRAEIEKINFQNEHQD